MSQLPDYVASAKPNPFENRAPWLTTTAATYAGIMLWFAFWTNLPGAGGESGGVLSQGLLFALAALVVAAFICYFCFYHVPGMLGMKTGLPLYIVGTSTYGVQGGFIMPGFAMGCLQFGWLSVNGYFAGLGFAVLAGSGAGSFLHIIIGVIWAVVAAFIGLKGIKYVGAVASYMPIIPIVALLGLLLATIGGVFKFDPGPFYGAKNTEVKMLLTVEPNIAVPAGMVAQDANVEGGPESEPAVPNVTVVVEEITVEAPVILVEAAEIDGTIATIPATTSSTIGIFGKAGKPGSLAGQLGVLAMVCAMVVGFFATAGAAGCDFGSNNKDRNAVIYGGLVGIVLATIFAGGIALIAIAGAQGLGNIAATDLKPYDSMREIMGSTFGGLFILLLAFAAFPSACFSSLIAANSFKATLPKVNPFISCGIGTAVACLLIATGLAGKAEAVFGFIGASFGPVCGAMMADYFLSGKKWAGPRAGFNPAGWISWGVGFAVGGLPLLGILSDVIPCPPVSAFIVGFGLYWILAQAGLESKKLDMPQRIDLE